MGWTCGNCGADDTTEELPDGRIDCRGCDHITPRSSEPPTLYDPPPRERRDTHG